MSIIPAYTYRLRSKVIECNGEEYIILKGSYPKNIREDIDNFRAELRAGHFIEPKPNGYMGFKVSTHAGTLVVNSTDITCPQNLHLIDIYSRSKLEKAVLHDDTILFFPENVKCMNVCFSGIIMESNDIEAA
ncbi:hypothetical protein NOVO_08640 [Rickettsiales bacterium Ac37b]|nr:hypothetical protein NOVO_08640 [Rickettsiales bacterium Ac37b]